MLRPIALLLLAFTTIVPAPAGEPALDKAKSRFATVDKISVHYKSLGEGKTALVLVHGWTCDLTFWEKQVPALEGKIRVVLIDLPGHGKSDQPKTEYTMDLFARAVEAVLTDARVEEAVLAGHSMGTPVVRQYYRLYPKKTKALIAVDGSLRPFTTDPKQIAKFQQQFEGPDAEKVAAKMIDSMFKPATPAALRERVKKAMLATPRHVAASAMRGMFSAEIWKEDKIEVPLLAVMARSPFWKEDYEKFVHMLAPRAEFHMMDDVGHFLMMENPAGFNRILIAFLNKHGVWPGG